MFCREQVAQLRDVDKEIRAHGATLAVVGNGTPEQAASFQRERGLAPNFALLTDPDLTAFRAAGLRRDLSTTLNLGVLAGAARALIGGQRQGPVQGDAWQQGGSFVIAPGDRVLYARINRRADDHADPQELVAALPG